MNIAEIVSAFSPIVCAIISIFTYSTLTSYRLDRIEESIKIVGTLDKRVSILEERMNHVQSKN